MPPFTATFPGILDGRATEAAKRLRDASERVVRHSLDRAKRGDEVYLPAGPCKIAPAESYIVAMMITSLQRDGKTIRDIASKCQAGVASVIRWQRLEGRPSVEQYDALRKLLPLEHA